MQSHSTSIRVYEKDKHSFFNELATCLISTIGVLISIEAYRNSGYTKAPIDNKYYLSLEGNDVDFHWECQKPMSAIVADSWPTQIVFLENVRLQQNKVSPYSGTGFLKLLATNIQSAFLTHYENQVSIIQSKYTDNPNSWPSVWNFARVIRNSIAHGGRINITNSKSASVNWRQYSYCFNDNGKTIVFKELGFVEFVLLMEDMETALI